MVFSSRKREFREIRFPTVHMNSQPSTHDHYSTERYKYTNFNLNLRHFTDAISAKESTNRVGRLVS
jgi:hypothetical protein